jgi:hypothetical protein
VSDLPGLEEYARTVEGHLSACRGREHVLSPREFALLRSWHLARVPLGTVLAGIDLACQARLDVTSLAWCRARVEQLAGLSARARSMSTSSATVGVDLSERLGALHQALSAQRGRARAAVQKPLARVEELMALVSVARRPNVEFLRRAVDEIDEAVAASALELVGEDRRAAFRGEAARALARQQGRVSVDELEAALTRYEAQRAREELSLPILGGSE